MSAPCPEEHHRCGECSRREDGIPDEHETVSEEVHGDAGKCIADKHHGCAEKRLCRTELSVSVLWQNFHIERHGAGILDAVNYGHESCHNDVGRISVAEEIGIDVGGYDHNHTGKIYPEGSEAVHQKSHDEI